MKKIFFALICLTFLASACEKNKFCCDLIAAKIIRVDCDRVIFQLLTEDKLGDTVWTDVYTGNRYTNVVSYYNTCKISEITKNNTDTLYIKLKKPATEDQIPCYQCLAVSQNPPQTKKDFEKIEKSPCLEIEVK